MNKSAEDYVRGNKMQREIVHRILQEQKNRLNWNKSDGKVFLDVGCGTGDVTVDILLPFISKDFAKLVAVDLSEENIEYTTKTYGNKDERITFQIMNISDDLNSTSTELYDHVSSFFCLHWVQNYRQAVENMFNLLKPGGDVFMIFVGKSFYWNALMKLAKSSKWRSYMSDISEHISPFHRMVLPEERFKYCLQETGFKEVYCTTQRVTKRFSRQKFIEFLTPLNWFEPRIPRDQREEFYDNLLELFQEAGFVVSTTDGEKFIKYNTVLISHARKPDL